VSPTTVPLVTHAVAGESTDETTERFADVESSLGKAGIGASPSPASARKASTQSFSAAYVPVRPPPPTSFRFPPFEGAAVHTGVTPAGTTDV